MRKGRKSKPAPSLPDEGLRAALRAYVVTFPSPERLRAHLDAHGLGDRDEAVRRDLDAVVRDVQRSIAGIERGKHFDEASVVAMLAQLRSRHAFLDEDAARSLMGFAMWFAWHEGHLPP